MRVVVVIPVESTSSPPTDSVQIAVPLVIVQSMEAVLGRCQLAFLVFFKTEKAARKSYKATALEVPFAYPSERVYAAVEGPAVRVKIPGNPQTLSLVPGTHSMA